MIARLSRRSLLSTLAGSGLVLAAACSENPVTGRSQLVLVSDEQLSGLGQAAWLDLQARTPSLDDPSAQARLERIGARLAEQSGLSAVNWEFRVFDSPDVNAFVLPGGKVGFFNGLMQLAQSDDEIAAVMGHEIGHVQARHAAERLSQQLALQLGMQIATVALAGEYGQYADEIAGALGMGALYGVILPYSRSHELEADRLGLSLMADGGYAPAGAVSFWERMLETMGASEPPALLSTHPASSERLAALRAAAQALL